MKYIAATLLVLIMVMQNVYAEPDKGYRITVNEESAKLTLIFRESVKYRLRYTEKGYLLSFDRRIAYLDLSGALNKLSPWVQTMWVGYDTLIIKPKSNISAKFNKLDNMVIVLFMPKSTVSIERNTIDTTNSGLALGRAKALLALKSERPGEARQMIMGLIKNSPENVLLILDLARIEESAGRWREALALYKKANKLQPYSINIIAAKKRLLNAHGTKIAVAAEYADVGNLTIEKATLLDGQVLVNNTIFSMDYIRLNAKDEAMIQPITGEMQSYDVVRHQYSFAAEIPTGEGLQSFFLYGGGKDLGAGWAYSLANDNGTGLLGINFKEPWYETSEAIFDYGYRDQIEIAYRKSVLGQAIIYSELSLNQYGLDSVDDAAESYRIQLGGRYTFKPISNGFSIGYGLDLEDIRNRASGTDIWQQQFFPLTLESREMHVLDFGWHQNLKNYLSFNSRLGYEYDRQSESHAPFGQIILLYRIKQALEWSFDFQTGLPSYLDRDERYIRVGSNLTYFFD